MKVSFDRLQFIKQKWEKKPKNISSNVETLNIKKVIDWRNSSWWQEDKTQSPLSGDDSRFM